MKADRPVNLELTTISFPITAITSILHRISGIAFFVGAAFAVWFLQASLSSAEGFATATAAADHWLGKLIIWGLLAALAYHLVMGIKHLIMDTGIGETIEGGRRMSQVALAISILLIVLAGVWVW
ncbi:MAG: succinate dehydrogenase, cytochrome b556 subunit [Natronospirillum sp.]|uniref:succinate dehydrogenase, cytochrome b556 subunit n=1 Tax=Natronospirillum sp. TaxID=2812955 RepID=UPI0025EF9079|nr:succinate dehydrogenase, cytochrome b556 subunit [Natronospirillum sp.]MCH8552367.1 succinate dehydrogenase, cytochrome b556 subunit [Natronospirillum sp.]